jgi:hypothetical protein
MAYNDIAQALGISQNTARIAQFALPMRKALKPSRPSPQSAQLGNIAHSSLNKSCTSSA